MIGTLRGDIIIFSFRDKTIRFKGPYSLVRFNRIVLWDKGYIVVTAVYDTLGEVEEYINLTSVLHNLMIDADKFLNPIKEVQILNV